MMEQIKRKQGALAPFFVSLLSLYPLFFVLMGFCPLTGVLGRTGVKNRFKSVWSGGWLSRMCTRGDSKEEEKKSGVKEKKKKSKDR